MNINDYGYIPGGAEDGFLPARVTCVQKERYGVVCAEGEGWARLKTGVYLYGGGEEYPTTGDFVLLDHNPRGDSLIVRTLPRRTYFSRRDPDKGRGEQAVAANFDTVFIMQSLNHDFNEKRLERYLTLAWQSGAEPVVVLTKADLAEEFAPRRAAAERLAEGVAVHAVSARSGIGLEELAQYLRPGKTVVFLGSSGVGKSSLVNALAGEELMAVSAIREDDSKGRHTTTQRQLLMLPCGAMVIDTPGMRALGMWDVSAGLGEAFGDVEQYLGRCRFSDCRHEREPGCAIKAAIASGALPQARWDSYLALRSEATYAGDKAAYLRRRQQWHKEIARKNRQIQKEGKR